MKDFKLVPMTRLLTICAVFLLSCIVIKGRKEMPRFPVPGKKGVAIIQSGRKYRLYRDGQPYYIKGANITDCRYLKDIQEAGGNSVHIYNTDHAPEILDSAGKLGLTVTIGLYMGYANRDIDYNNPAMVKKQFNRIKKEILKYRNHPALLMWGVGNETTLFLGDGLSHFFDHIHVSRAIDAIAQMIHQEDPNHPAVLMVTGGSKNIFNSVFCGNIDLIGYNSFEPFGSQLKKSYWNGPYIVSEFGPPAYWISPQTEWYKYIEPTSSQKMRFMDYQYRSFQSDSLNCLGAYAFFWGHKQEYTSTWFSLYTKKDEPTVLVDKLHWLWTGMEPVAETNEITSLLIDNTTDATNIYLEAGKRYTAKLVLKDMIASNNVVSWEIQTDNKQEFNLDFGMETMQSTVDSGQMPQKNINPAAIGNQYEFTINAPTKRGPYRLFLFLKETNGKIATANACFYVYNTITP